MKNTLFLCFILALSMALFSCESKPTIKPRFTETQGIMSVRVINKNDAANILFSAYKTTYFQVEWLNAGNSPSMISINGNLLSSVTSTPISRWFSLRFLMNTKVPNTVYNPIDKDDFYQESTKHFVANGDDINPPSRSHSLDANNTNENLTVIKNDADSLVGNFRVRLRTVSKNSIDTITVEGKFNCAKNGLFVNPR